MILEHDSVILTKDIPGTLLKAGDKGVVVHSYGGKTAFEVEFFDVNGNSVALETILSTDIKNVELTARQV